MEYYKSVGILLLLLFTFSSSSSAGRQMRRAAEETRMLSTSSNLRVIEGSSVLLPCNAFNTAETDVRMWTKLPSRVLFSGLISVSSDPKISLVDKSSLHIVNITQQYSGDYLCSFFRKPHLKVLHKILVLVPPSISTDPSHGKVIEQRGSPAKMICHAKGVPSPSITWTYEMNGTQVTTLPSGVHQLDETQLEVESVDSHQAGHYRCTADNEVGVPATADFNLTVLYAPEVIVRPDWIHGDEDATVEFSCTSRSAPLSQMVWMKGDPKQEKYLQTDDRIKIREKTTPPTVVESWLKIQRMRREDLGSYTCLGRNAVGQAWKTVEVSGLAEPVQIRGSGASEGDSFLLLWTAKSYSPIIEYQLKIREYKEKGGWTDVMIPVEGGHKSIFYSQSYNVTGLDPDQRYEVVLQAHNDFGWNRPSQSLFFGSGVEILDEADTQNIMLSTPSHENELDVTNPAYLSKGRSFVAADGLIWLFLVTTAAIWRRLIM